MKKEIINEIKRIQELIGTKSIIQESIIDDLLKFLNAGELSSIKNALSARKLDPNNFDHVITVIRKYPNIYDKIFNEINSILKISVSDFETKTFDDLLDLASSQGIDPDLAGEWIQNFEKKNNVTFKPDVQSPTPNPLKPTKKPKISDENLTDDIVEKIKQKLKKTNPKEFETFNDRLEVLKPTREIEKRMWADFEHYWDWKTSELESEIGKIASKMNEKQLNYVNKLFKLLNIKNWTYKGAWSKGLLVLVLIILQQAITCLMNKQSCWNSIVNFDYSGKKTTNGGTTSGSGTTSGGETNTNVGKKPKKTADDY